MLDFLIQLDYSVLRLINGVFTYGFMDSFFFWITDLHKTILFKIIVIPLVIFLFIKKYRHKGWILFFSLLVALSFSDYFGAKIKSLVERPRPKNNTEISIIMRSDAGHFSFYSNHASNMFTFATYTSTFIPQIKLPVYLIAASVGYSRIYNGVHYPSDVLAGSFFGYLWGLMFSKFASFIMLWYQKKRGGK